jgi:Ca-activated chloride channel family protein
VQPVSFELLIDISGSMKGNKIQEAKAAASKLVAEILDLKTHEIGIATFGDNAEEISQLSQNKQELLNKIERIDAGNHWTNMQAGIEYGSRILIKNSKKKVLLIVTDGSPCTGGSDSRDEANTKKAADKAHAEGIDIITIAVGRSANTGFLHRIATTGMDYTIDSMDKLAETFETAVKQYLQVK